MAILNINGTDYEVQGFVVSYKELDLDSGRNLRGVMERNVLSHHVRTLDATFPPMNATKMSSLINNIDRATSTIRFYNIKTKAMSTMSCMHGDITPELKWYKTDTDSLYNPLKVQFVEY